MPHTKQPLPDAVARLISSAKNELNNILDWWASKMPDVEHGGFYGRIDGTGRLHPTADKSVILNTRILWTFSAAARITGQRSHQDIAKRAYDYITKYFWDADAGGVYWMLDYQGNPSQDKKQVYAQSFALYALSEYYLLTKDQTVLNQAQALFDLMERYSLDKMRRGYYEAFSRDWQLIADLRLSDRDANEAKTMNTHLHVMEAYTNFYRIAPTKQVENALKSIIVLFLDKFLDPQTSHLRLFFDENWNLKSDEISFGHDIEASWLICEAARVLGNNSLIKKADNAALQIAEATLREGTDQTDGGVFYTAHPEHGIVDAQKDWWPQAEAVLGYLNAWKIGRSSHFLDASLHSWQFIQENLLDFEQGEWFWALTVDGQADKVNDKAGPWKCPYHNGRACMEIMQYGQ